VAAAADYFMLLTSGNSIFVASFLNINSNRRRLLLNQSDADYFIQVQTTVSLVSYPSYISNPPSLFKYLSGLLSDAVASGAFSKYLQSISKVRKAVGTANATCLDTTYEHLNVIYPSTATPTGSPVTMQTLGKLGNAEMAGVIIAALLLTFMLALTLYTVVRRIGKVNKEQNLVKKFSFANSMQAEYPKEKAVQFTLKDADLDKLEYVGDTAKI